MGRHTFGLEEDSVQTRGPSVGKMEEVRELARVVIHGLSLDQEVHSLMGKGLRIVWLFSTTSIM
jgi:hypothetical protein